MAHDHISKKIYSKSMIVQCPDSTKFKLGHATSTSLLTKKRGVIALNLFTEYLGTPKFHAKQVLVPVSALKLSG